METWNSIKEEATEGGCCESKNDHYDTSGSYSTYDLEKLHDVKIENGGEFVKAGETGQDPWKTASSYFPKLSIPLTRLEYSQNKEVVKFLKALKVPPVTSSTKMRFGKGIRKLDINLKLEYVELETLNENTLMQSSNDDRYALPWHFVSLQGTCDQNSSMKDTTNMKMEDETLFKKSIAKEYDGRDTRALKTKYTQESLSFGSILAKRRKMEKATVDTAVELSNENFEVQLVREVCGKPHAPKYDLQQHSLSHDPTNWYKCELCKKKFKLKIYLRQHMRSHARKQYTGDICESAYSRQAALTRHKKLHPVGTRKSKKSGIASQKKVLEKGNKDDQEIPLKLYKCDVCGERFEQKSSMKVHIEFLHVEIFGNGPITKVHRFSSSLCKKRPFQCGCCDKRYIQLAHLRRHQTSHLSNLLESDSCGLCKRRFSTAASLSKHVRNVHGIKDVYYTTRKEVSYRKKQRPTKVFECKICGNSFGYWADLRKHCATHDARKPYECDICKKKFALKVYLYSHILIHADWKPYPCESCPKFYRHKASLLRHINIRHSNK